MCIGGATPGKLIMGLKIVKCNQIVPLGINRVQVGSRYVDIYSCNFTVEILEIGNNVLFALSLESTVKTCVHFQVVPATDMGFGWALVRSVLKNFSLAFFFPVCFSLMFLPYSRTLYDIMSRWTLMLIILIFCYICFNAISAGQSLWRTTSDSTETSDCIDSWIYDVICNTMW